ncbi:MAG: MFS transporter [Acetobacteraceae bacterium]|nr:MFS transporter [Acetobacteraceae bacterium]
MYALTHRVRWRIYAFLFTFGFIAYLQQKGLTVAAERIMPELHFSQEQIGWLEWACVLGYAAFQFPGGVIGQRVGARLMFTVIGSVAFLATILTPMAPVALAGSALFVTLFALQLIMGLAQGAIFPVGSGVMETWFRPERWALIQGVQSAGLQLAAAATPPVVAYLMSTWGWQRALFWPAFPAVLVIVLWAWYARNSPREHPSVTPEELAELGKDAVPPASVEIDGRRLRHLLANRSILLATFSYVCMNYVFYLISNWCFLYLVQERNFNVLEGGWLAIWPPLAAAAGAAIGGPLVGLTCARFGITWGFRVVPMVALPASGALLLITVNLSNPYAAVGALALAYAVVELCEAPFWAATMFVGRADTMSASGVLNTGGNGGGLIGIPIVAYLSGHGHWTTAFVIGAIFSLIGAVAWLGIDAEQRFEMPETAATGSALAEGLPKA